MRPVRNGTVQGLESANHQKYKDIFPHSTQAGRETERLPNGADAGDAFSRDIESGSVRGRRYRRRQSPVQSYALLEAHQLHRDLSLIVIHRYDCIKVAASGGDKERVRRVGTARVDAFAPHSPDSRADYGNLLLAQQTPFAGMR